MRNISDSELTTDDFDDSENPEPYDPGKDPIVIQMREILANMDPSEYEEDPPSPYKPDLSMWETIRKLPIVLSPDPSRGAAKFRATLECRERSRAAGIVIPQRNSTKDDHINYDDS